jgi:hypothetical protein
LRDKFEEASVSGRDPYFVHRRGSGWHMRTRQEGNGADPGLGGGGPRSKKPETDTQARKPETTTRSRLTPTLKSALQFTADFIPPNFLVDLILQRGFLYSLTAQTGDGKTAILLLLVYCIAFEVVFGTQGVEQGRVCFFAGENPDDVRMRWIAMGERLKFDQAQIPVDFIEGVFPLPRLRDLVAKADKEYALIVIDSSAVYFPGDEENSNTQAGSHARTMRTLTTLPGKPTVVVACHPTKSADPDRLLPRGGGAFVN